MLYDNGMSDKDFNSDKEKQVPHLSAEGDETIVEIATEHAKEFRRLDQLLAHQLPLSRSFLKKLFLIDAISAENASGEIIKIDLKKMPAVGTKITILIPPPTPSEAKAENIPLEILFEDEHLLFVNKPAGLVTHPAPGNYTGTLVNAVLFHCPDLKGIGNEKRPGIVHRLDKGTSGVMVVAKTQAAHEALVLMFSKHDIDRIYEAIVVGRTNLMAGKIETTIGRHPSDRLKMAANVKNGKKAVTYYKVLEYLPGLTHLQCKLETGRTHQIRIHLSTMLKTAILGDNTYAHLNDQLNHLKKIYPQMEKLWDNYPYPLLHAKTLGLIHPITQEKLSFTVAPPNQFLKVLELAKSTTKIIK